MRRRLIRFRGGVLDGVREVGLPLAPGYAAAVPAARMGWLGAADADPFVTFPVDEYELVRHVDHTGIPEMQYHLRRMVR